MILALPLAWAVYQEDHWLVLVLGIIVFISDYADGYLARKFNEVTELGKVIDPLADKVVVVGVAIALLITNRTPLWFLIVIAARDILIVLGGLYIRGKLKGFTLPSNILGKLTINVLAVVFLFQYLGLDIAYFWGSLLGLIFLILSFISYMYRAVDIINKSS